ncbi:MAG: hypothetical protein P0S94_00980, partial [Simkaniaceae bacterium]|nr:hypothetical protein [Simkaniaceae bacterium]
DIALGISKSVPHLLLTSKKTKDTAIFHGGDTASLFFADEQGNVSLFLSKDGLYQGKKEEKKEKKGPPGKIFTWDPEQNPLKDLKTR